MAGSTAPGSDAPKTTPAAQSRMRLDRLARLQQSLRVAGCAGAVLSDPINIRYACDARNMQVWTMHVPSRYLFVPPTGRATLFDYGGAEHLAAGLETLSEIARLSRSVITRPGRR